MTELGPNTPGFAAILDRKLGYLIISLPTSQAWTASISISTFLPASALAISQKLSLCATARFPHGPPNSFLHSPLPYALAAHLHPYLLRVSSISGSISSRSTEQLFALSAFWTNSNYEHPSDQQLLPLVCTRHGNRALGSTKRACLKGFFEGQNRPPVSFQP